MAVYVDDMFAPFRMATGREGKMSHLFADSHLELELMAAALRLKPAWIQHEGTWKEHYDVTMNVRKQAIELGAIPISYPHETGVYSLLKKVMLDHESPEVIANARKQWEDLYNGKKS